MIHTLEIRIIRARHCIVVGKAVLAKFKTSDEAVASLENNRALYQYWAGSAGVSIQNTEPKIVNL